MQLNNTKEAFDVVFEESLAGFWDWNISSGEEYVNPSFKKVLGYEDHQIKNTFQSYRDLIHNEDVPLVTEAFKKHVLSLGKVPYQVTARYRHSDGSYVYLLTKGKVVEWDDEENPLRMIGCHVDISFIYNSQAELKHRYERKQIALEGLSAGIWDRDLVNNKDWWSPKYYELLGYEAEEIEAGFHTFLDHLLHPEDREKVMGVIDSRIAEKEDFQVEIQLKTKAGKYSWFVTSGKARYNEKGEPTRVAGILMNIDERKQMQQKLEKSEFLLKQVNEMARVGGWEYNIEQQKIIWSKEIYEIHGLPLHFVPTLNSTIEAYLPEYRVTLLNAINNVIADKKSYDLELILQTADGKNKWVRAIGKPVLNEHNNVVALLGAVQDIDDKKTKELELQKSTNIIGDQNNRLKNFAHIVSHNLRSHAGNIQTVLTLMKITDNEADRQLFFDNLEKISQALNQTIAHLTEVVKIQTEVESATVAINLKQLFSSIINILTPTINATGTIIESSFEWQEINYVPAYLESILLNLVSNAIKYRHPDRTPHVELKTFFKGETKMLSVQDNGLGIDLAKHRDKVFGMYKTFHQHPDARGIGLFITKNQIEALGGTITVASEPGQGTTFTIQF